MNPISAPDGQPGTPLNAVPAQTPLPAMQTESVAITPIMAEQWLTKREYAYQRHLREGDAERFAEHMRAGTFENTQAINFHHCLEHGGAKYLTNGQHRLRAVVLSGMTIEMPVVHKWVRTYAAVQAAYGRIDRGITRTHQDVYRANGLEEELDLGLKDAERFGAAVAVFLRDFRSTGYGGSRTRDAGMRMDLMRGWIHDARALVALYEGAPSDWRHRLLNAMPFALGLVTFRYAPEQASRFWRELAWGEGLTVTDTTYHLREHLSKMTIRGKLSERQIMWTIARGWNAFYRGRLIQLFKNTEGRTPDGKLEELELAGTPFRGTDKNPQIRA